MGNAAKNIGFVLNQAKTKIMGFMTWTSKEPHKLMMFKESCCFYVDSETNLPMVKWADSSGKIWKGQLQLNSIVPDGQVESE
jgi:hypothetical protein